MKPLTYFPRPLTTVAPRDLLLLETLPTGTRTKALEIGTGSGSSLLRLANWFGSLHGVDVSTGPIQRLRRQLQQCSAPVRDVELFALDFCDPDAARGLPGRYDLVFSCDTLEHVQLPARFVANVYRALKPGGSAFITYPNENPERAHGITWFEKRCDLERLFLAAGFKQSRIEIQTLRMNRWAEWVFQLGWLWPRYLAKLAVHWNRGKGTIQEPPQTFDQTEFFAAASKLEHVAPAINAYCWIVLKLMSLARPVYEIRVAPDVIWDTQVLIRAVRDDSGS
jgi:SAM-dependent methyltransferase